MLTLGARPLASARSARGMRAAIRLVMQTHRSNRTDDLRGIPTLDQRYELFGMLGEGAMGKVYAAFDRELGIDVAIKIMNPAFACSKRHVVRFTEEARTCSRMCSPHVVKVLGLAVTSEGVPCMVTELLEGETLAERIDREGGVSLPDTCEIIKQTARALTRAHNLGVVHRDVKPANIFLTSDEHGRLHVKLIDFGIATTVGEGANELAGTVEYMAPETLLGAQAAGKAADLYALAAVAFECLTGRAPVVGTLREIVEQLRSGAVPSLADHRPDLAPAFDEWMARGLHPDPFWRFSSAAELARALEGAASASFDRAADAAAVEWRLSA